MAKDINNIDYDLELDRVVENIKKNKAMRVLLQFPDGLKPYATEIAKEIEKRVSCKIYIWLGSCYGACDTPNLPEKLNIDLLVQFGHSEWK